MNTFVTIEHVSKSLFHKICNFFWQKYNLNRKHLKNLPFSTDVEVR